MPGINPLVATPLRNVRTAWSPQPNIQPKSLQLSTTTTTVLERNGVNFSLTFLSLDRYFAVARFLITFGTHISSKDVTAATAEERGLHFCHFGDC